MTLKEIYQDYLDMSDAERLFSARQSANGIMAYLKRYLTGVQAAEIYTILFSTYVGADGEVDEAEYQLYKDIFEVDIDYPTFTNMVASYCTVENLENIDRLMDGAPAEVKTYFVMLGIAVCSCNGTMTVTEQALLQKYLD